MDACDDNPEQSYTTRVGKHEAFGFSIVAKSPLTDIKEKNICYRGEDWMEKYCKKLREWVMKIVNYEMKEMIPLTNDEKEYHENRNKCFICNKRFCYDKKNKSFRNFKKVRDHCHYTGKHRGAAHSICNLKYETTKKIPVIFHNGSKYTFIL